MSYFIKRLLQMKAVATCPNLSIAPKRPSSELCQPDSSKGPVLI